MALLHNMRKTSTTADMMGFNVALTSCAKGDHWERLLLHMSCAIMSLLGKMRKAAMNAISFITAISTCGKVG